MKKLRVKPLKTEADGKKARARPGRNRAIEEVERLRGGGELDESLIVRMSLEERVLLEVALIDALTKWPRDQQHRLRSTLIKHGYDEHCSRRVMKETIPDSVRASTLLHLLRPQSQVSANVRERRLKTENLKLAASAGASGEVDGGEPEPER
jgi:hypothetical protein